MTVDQQLDNLIATLPHIDQHKNYWLIRTQSGSFYEDFIENNIIAIEPSRVSKSNIKGFENKAGGDEQQILQFIKDKVLKDLDVTDMDSTIISRTVSLKSNQIFKFVYQMKKGDIIIIPSKNSEIISIGEVIENNLALLNESEISKIKCSYDLNRRIKWRKHISRASLDPNLYKLFGTHQTLSEVEKYSEIIERSLNDLYIMKETSHLILEVRTEFGISAKDLFGLGYDLLKLIDEYAKYASISINSSDIEVEVNLNSPGKIDLKSRIQKTTVVMGLILLVAGGGYEDSTGHKLKTDGFPGILKSISGFLKERDDQSMKKELFNTYKDSLDIKNSEDLNKALKQFSENKDLPK